MFIHNPTVQGIGKTSGGRHQLGTLGDISLLNINQVVSSIATGRLDPASIYDSLVVGTQTNILGYDVMNNRDIFYRDVSKPFYKL